MMQPPTEHPFAQYVRILGKGKTGTRSLHLEEAREAFAMILRGEAEPVQLGAFLMLLRVKEESPEEMAGFIQACRDNMAPPPAELSADLDWSSYAGKKHQHPWFILAMLLLAGAGYRVFVHGSAGHTPGRLYTETAMTELGLPVAGTWADVGKALNAGNLCCLPLQYFLPALQDVIALKPILGLRSPVNTLTRMMNPLGAPASIQSIFHPAYAHIHREADRLLGQPASLVFKGDSGEVEVKPHADTRLQLLRDDVAEDVLLTRTRNGRVEPVQEPSTGPLRTLWRGATQDTYGLEATLATTAAALLLLQPGDNLPDAQAQAQQLWEKRDKDRLG